MRKLIPLWRPLLISLIVCFFAREPGQGAERGSGKPNVLLIIADDLNDWIGPMKGHPQVKTPNLDKLAARGVTFMNAYVCGPICNPSRASFMTGRRPSTTGIYDNQQPAMPHIPRGVALNDYLRQFGYKSFGAGKIYHYRNYREVDWDKVVFHTDDTLPGQEADRRPGQFGYRMFTEGEPTERYNEQRDESKLIDAQSVAWCIEQLSAYPETERFFMACGVHRPHTPWDVPKKYFDLYPLESVQLPTVRTNDLEDVPAAGVAFANPQGPHAAILKAGLWQDRVRAYLAAISFADAQIGRLLEALEKSKHRDHTIIVFVSDHGWHLGQKEHWAKSALWRQATRVPYIWSVPGLTKGGIKCERAVDLASLFPTICELTGVPVPRHAEGISLKPLLANPDAEWKHPAITTHLKGNDAISTEEWRYIRYAEGSEELYNQKTDPHEWNNVAGKAEFAKVKAELAKSLPSVNAEPVQHQENPKKKKKGKRKAE